MTKTTMATTITTPSSHAGIQLLPHFSRNFIRSLSSASTFTSGAMRWFLGSSALGKRSSFLSLVQSVLFLALLSDSLERILEIGLRWSKHPWF